MTIRPCLIPVAALTMLATACGSDDAQPTEPAGAESTEASLATVSASDAAAAISNSADGLVVLDVRTPEEFAEVRLDGATMIDFYEPDFGDQLAELDRDADYVLYCRSGNRSGQTLAMMRKLGFTSVQEVDGGILAWLEAGLPTVDG